ncbi:MAG: HIT family protein [Promethearchaeota archaeon]
MVSDPIFPRYLTVPWKAKYVHGKKKETCFICQIRDKTNDSPIYELYRNETVLVFLNIFPYQVGHLLVSPKAHLTCFENLPTEIVTQLFRSIQKCVLLLKKTYGDQIGINIGLNQGKFAGASQEHLHWHCVPRFPASELNWIDVLGTRVLIETLEQTHQKLLKNVEVLIENN